MKFPKSRNNKRVISYALRSFIAIILIAYLLINAIMLTKNNNLNPQGGVTTAELEVSKTYAQVEEGDEATQSEYVKFDAFFLRDLDGDGYAESIRGACREIGGEDTLYMELNVMTAGYLRDGKITVNGENFYLQTALPKDDELKDNYIGNNIKTIEFNDLANGTQKMLTGIVRSGDYSYSSQKAAAIGNNTNNYSKVNSVTLTGTWVSEDGQSTVDINKTVDFTIDWHGVTKASINTTNQTKYLEDTIDEENGTVNADFTIYTQETANELLLSSHHVEGEIPELNGYAPIDVSYTGSIGTFNYDAETRTFTIDREASVGEDGTITSSISRSSSYSIKVTYPIEAYRELGTETMQIKIPVKTYYEGYNNPSEEFTNPYKSNIAASTIVLNYRNLPSTEARFDVTVGKYVSSPSGRYIVSKEKPLRIYNGVSEKEKDDTYLVAWKAYIGTDQNIAGIVMKETKTGEQQVTDNFIKTDSSEESMEDVVSNIGIYFSNQADILGEDGWIKVYDDETDELIYEFTSSDWSKYTSSNPYKYELPVKHIRIETSVPVSDENYLYVYNIKELDDEKIVEKYDRENFDNLQYIKSTLVGYIGETYVNTDVHQANYEAPISVANISISNNTISTQSTEENDIITITANANTNSNQVAWQNGTFLVKLSEEIIDAEINNVEVNNSNVTIGNYELIEQDGSLFIKIMTQNDTPQSFSITIDTDITPDPRIATMTRQVELYASNENGENYYYTSQDIYDVDNDLNTEELVNYRTASISMVSPNSLLTNQIASNYDDKGSEIVSPEIADIKPVYAVVDQEQEEQTATVGVQIRNNYGSTISEIKILGKIPFEGNTYVLSGGDLGSTFTTKMVESGIQIPEELAQYATVYYSENETPTKDLEDEENGWITADKVENWDNIKTYLIDLGNYVMPTGKEYVFDYTVKIPNGLEFNEVSYSHHGVYFCLDTDEGKYRTQTEPNRLGFRIAEKYDLELTKYQTGKDKLVPGATYSITDVETGESKTGVTNAEGKLTIRNLYAEKEYEIKEIKTPDDYELNSEVIRFIGHVDENGVLTIEKLEGTTRDEITVAKEENENYKVTVNVEDESKATLKIVKKEQGTDTVIQGARFKLTGYGLSENGRTVTTNINGEITLRGLSVNQEYSLEEVKAEGYYLSEPIKFKIVNNEGSYSVEKIEDETATGEITAQTTTEEDSIPTISIIIEDEKIPTYDLQLIKIKKTTSVEEGADGETSEETTYLEGAKFKLYKGTEEIGSYTTGADGKVTITGLYEYEEEKDIDQTYTLKEVLAPEGYAKVKDISFKAEVVEGNLVLKEIDEEGEETESARYTAEGNTISLTIEDSQSFRLIKKDAETGEVLAGVKFAIYNVDDGTEQPATNSKGEIIGTLEEINVREYYTVTTDKNGELTLDLPEGLYKAVEVEANEKYDIEGQEYYFGIGASREAPTTIGVTQAINLGGNKSDSIKEVLELSDGGYIVVGDFFSSYIQLGEYILENKGVSDGFVAKFNKEGEVEWATSIGADDQENLNSATLTNTGEILVAGEFYSRNIKIGDYTLNNNNSNYYSDIMIIKYSEEGDVISAEKVGGNGWDEIDSITSTSDGGYILGGTFESDEIKVGSYILTTESWYSGLIIKYDKEGEVEWATSVGGTGANGASIDGIHSVVETNDGGYIAGGYFNSEVIQLGDYTLTKNGNDNRQDALLIKYNSKGGVEWASNIGGNNNDHIVSVAATNDGGYIVGGYFSGNIQVGDKTIYGYANNDGIIIKYDKNNKVEWIDSIGNYNDDEIETVSITNDGGYIVGGYFESSKINIGDYELVNSNIKAAGMIIKYNKEGEVEWAKCIDGDLNEDVEKVIETSSGDYIAVGSFESEEIQLGDYTLKNFTNSGSSDGMIIKLGNVELGNPVVTKTEGIGGSDSDYIYSVAETKDGGYVAGGDFSGSIQVGDNTLKSNLNTDGIIIKYDREGEVEWVRSVGESGIDVIYSVTAASDGGVIVGGRFQASIQVGDNTLTSNGYFDGMIIKYDSEGEVEWAKNIGGSDSDYIYSVAETKDGGYIAGGYFKSSSINLDNYTLQNKGNEEGMLIKYSYDGKVEWARSVGGSNDDEITSVVETKDGGYIAGGYFKSSSIQVEDYTLTNTSSSTFYTDGMIIKYDSEGEVEWARSIGCVGKENFSDEISAVSATSDGGVIAGGTFSSDSIQVGDYILTNNDGGYDDGMIIKYDSEGEVEWARSVGGSVNDYIQSVVVTSDGGIIAGGTFSSDSIQVGDYILTNNDGGYDDGMIIKLDSEGKIEWTKGIGGSNDDEIYAVTETTDGRVIAGGYFESSSIEVDGQILTNQGKSDGMILEVVNQVGVPEVQELTVENNRKEYEITTDVIEIDGIKGGSISGEDKEPYETVKYGDTSTQEIKMTPDSGYEIIKITINGEEVLDYELNPDDGSYILPQFTNMTEDKHIIVTYALSTNKITLNKVDSKTQEPLTGAKFKLDQIEERTEPNAEEIFGELTDNGATYTIADTENEVTTEGIFGELTDNGTYYFVENEDGSLVPTNSKTYQTENIEGATTGVQSSTANSYIQIDLSALEGEYVVVVNAQVSSESGYDYGYATITENTAPPSYNSSTGRFIYVSGNTTTTTAPTDYTSLALEGGKTYYLHLGYRKDGSGDAGDDQVIINSIKLYKATTTTYEFDEIDGVYKSNNQGKDSTTANSYIEIDLSNLTGKYDLTVNAEISSQSSDYGYVTVTNTEDVPAYNSSTGRIAYISGEQEATDYTTILQGGQIYYLHFGYYKDSTTSSGEDTFTINSINLSLNDSDLYHIEVEVDGNGQAITQVPYGKYLVTEVETPEGYLTMEPITIEFREDGNSIVTDENNVKVAVNEAGEFVIPNEKQARVIVHHYLRDNDGTYTTMKLAEDEIIVGNIGETYTTSPNLNITGYELIKDEEGNYIIPDGNNTYYESAASTGTYQSGDIEIIYYYEEAEIPLTVHHYIEGTTTPVPLADGSSAQDENYIGKAGESYTTDSLTEEELDSRYELVEVPSNAEGTYSVNEVIVTYYYRIIERPLTIVKTGEDGEALSGVKFEIQTKEESESKAKIEQNGTYYFVEQKGKYISNNQEQNNTTANSYIKIDLTDKEDATIKINAEISSESGCDYGYATITESTTAPSYNNSTGRFIYISGQVAAKNYETTLEGGKVYYLHLGYRKDGSINRYNDTFTINSIKINNYEILNRKLYTTNEEGKITTNLRVGDYVITEIETPEAYKIPENPTQNITITKDQDSYELNIVNEKKRGTVIVHHYIEGTEEKVPLNIEGQVAEDEIITGLVGESYRTEVADNIDSRYELVYIDGDSEGNIQEGTYEVIYYYDLKEADLKIIKTDENGNGVAGAVFEIENQISGESIFAYTEENGGTTIRVPVGETIVTELEAPEGYKLNSEPVNITIEEDGENVVTVVDEAHKIFDIAINKIDSETVEPIENTYFELSYDKEYVQFKAAEPTSIIDTNSNSPYERVTETINKQYITSEDGTIKLEGLYDDVEYTIEETRPANGYVESGEKYRFKVHYVDGEYQIEMLEGEFDNIVIDGNQINITVENDPTLKEIKQDEEGNLLPGAKFTITDEEGNLVTNGKGETVGTEENINGQMMTVVTTDEEGKIVENLEPGKYIVTEVEAPYGYALPENEEDRVKEIEITASRYAGNTIEKIEEISLNNIDLYWVDFDKLELNADYVVVDGQGNINIAGGLLDNYVITAEHTISGEEISLEKVSMADGLILTVNKEGKIVKVKQVKSPENAGNMLAEIFGNKNGDILAAGMLTGNLTIPAEETENNQEITITGTSDGIEYIICFNKEGKVKYVTEVDESLYKISQPIDMGYRGNDFVIQGITDSNSLITIIFDENGNVSKNEIQEPNINEEILSSSMAMAIGKEQDIVVSGWTENPITLDSSETANGEEVQVKDGFTIKYNQLGKAEWITNISGLSQLMYMKEASNGYLGIMVYMGEIRVPEDNTTSGEEIVLNSQSTEEISTALIKYNEYGQVEWITDINIDINDLQDLMDSMFMFLQETETGYSFYDPYTGIVQLFKETPTEPIADSQQVVTLTNTYIGPEIDQVKLMSTENNLDYVVPGEKIIYTIIAKNSGGLPKDVLVQDTIPEGTTFVEGSIKVNSLSSYNGTDLTTLTADDLANGITLNVPAGSLTSEGFVRLSFEVTVNDDSTGEIRNIGTVDGEQTNEVTKPVVTTEKVSSVIRHDETSTLTDNQVTVNDQIRYTVRVTNTGTTTVNDVEVKDSVPAGTKLISIDNEGIQEDDEITWTIASIAEGETKEVSFTVKVEYAKENYTITNVATVDDNQTNEVENPYVKPDPELESTLAKNGTDKVTSKDQTVNYEVKFTATVDDFKGTAKVTLVDTLPYAIDISQSKLDNGTYNSENNTITWEQEIDVDTFETDEPKDIVIAKSIEVVYLYEDINAASGSMLNTVDSKIELIETDSEEPVLTDEKEAEKETIIEMPAEVVVHHYIYDAETEEYTTIKLAPDETIDGLVGQDYTTSKSSQVPSNYSCINEQPNNYSGKMTEETIEVNYYYSLITPTITNTMDKTADSSILTTEGEEVTYNIRYTASIDNYIGKATVVIVDTLPAEIDVDKSNLGDGIYDPTYKTITWEEIIEDVNTFTNGTYNYEFERTMSLVYTGQNMAEDLTNTVVGTVNVYYPENHPTKPDEVQETETAEDTEVVEQDYKVDLKVEKVWDDNNNEKGHRPDGIMVTIAGGDINNKVVELNDSNNWIYEEKGLDKYDEHGNLINYSVAESEKSPGDLQYYTARFTELSTDDPTVKSYRFTNTYKLTSSDLDANVTKTGPEEITSSTEPVDYEINFTSTVKDYIGDGKVIITDTLPYRIDESKSNLDGGTYDDEARTITWEEDLNNIDTFTNGDYAINITKNISVVFVDLDSSANSITNTVLGKVRLYETEQEDQATDEADTLININGDVIVKYVDIDTNEEISDRVTLTGKVGDEYTTSRKQIEGYEYVKSTPNTEGNITEETQEVIYYYQRKDATIIVKYQDTDGNELTEDVIIDGKVGDDYTTEQKEFEDYEFVSVTDNANGTMTEETITVIYVYQQTPAKVIVKYLEKGTDKQLALDDEIIGQVGDEYSTDRKVIKNYQSAEPEPDNKSGTMIKGVITVIYYYERIPAGDVIVKYVDIDTDEEILYKDTETGEDKTYGYTISGYVGDNYEAEQKDIPYYNFIRSTTNTTGQLTEAGDTVIYYYQKQSFNLGITKSISEITLDGSSKGVGDGKNTKVEIHRKKINTADLEVKYKIVVSNTGEISGTAKVIDALPSGYIVSSNNPTYWTSSNVNLETQVELQPGESKELEVVLKWVNGESSFGTGENIARITDINNPANYAETTQKDNEDKATIVTSVETGINRNVYLIITTYLLMIGLVVLLYLYEQYQKERKGEISSRKTLKLKLPNDKK